jgi:hypothetical protein
LSLDTSWTRNMNSPQCGQFLLFAHFLCHSSFLIHGRWKEICSHFHFYALVKDMYTSIPICVLDYIRSHV